MGTKDWLQKVGSTLTWVGWGDMDLDSAAPHSVTAKRRGYCHWGEKTVSTAQRMHFQAPFWDIPNDPASWDSHLDVIPGVGAGSSDLLLAFSFWLASSLTHSPDLWWSQLPCHEGAVGKLTWQSIKGGLGPGANEELRPQYNRLWGNERCQQPQEWAGKCVSPWLGSQMRPRDI